MPKATPQTKKQCQGQTKGKGESREARSQERAETHHILEEIQEGIEGLVHVSEMSWSTHLRSAQDFVKVGDEVDAIILSIDRESRKMSLGIKQITPDPWTDLSLIHI